MARFRNKILQVWLNQTENSFVSKYAEKHLMTTSELIRFWIHEAMKKEGVYDYPSGKIRPKSSEKRDKAD